MGIISIHPRIPASPPNSFSIDRIKSMPTDIVMPKLGLTMEEGTIVHWRAAEGDRVAQGQPLLEVETDKVTVEVEAPATGVMAAPLVGEGQKVPVGTLLGRILDTEEEILRCTQDDSAEGQGEGRRNRVTPLARRMAACLAFNAATSV